LHKIPGMKNGLLILNGVLIIAVAILFYLHFSSGKKETKTTGTEGTRQAVFQDTSTKGCRIAYMEMDSIDNNLDVMKEVRKELDKKKDSITEILAKIDKSIRDKANEYQNKFQTMTPTQLEMARNDINQRNNDFEITKQQYNQIYVEAYNARNQQVRGEIEDFLKTYNKDRRFSFIMVYDPGLFYYRDTMYNITSDVIKGVNEIYRKKKK
jgi:outer membrane protein